MSMLKRKGGRYTDHYHGGHHGSVPLGDCQRLQKQ